VATRSYGQRSGLARAVEAVGERWALLIVRDLLAGPRRFTDLRASLPRIPTNILTTRLRELQDAGVARRVPVPRCGLVYELTPRGRELEGVVLGLERWGASDAVDEREGEGVSHESLAVLLEATFDPVAAASSPDAVYRLGVREEASGGGAAAGDGSGSATGVPAVALEATVRAGGLSIVPTGERSLPAPLRPAVGGATAADGVASSIQDMLAFETTDAGIHRLVAAELHAAEALADRVVRVVDGDTALLERFVATFHV